MVLNSKRNSLLMYLAVDKKGKMAIDYCTTQTPQMAMYLVQHGAKANFNQVQLIWQTPEAKGDSPPALRGATLTEYQGRMLLFGSGVVAELISDLYWLDRSIEYAHIPFSFRSNFGLVLRFLMFGLT